MDGMKNPMRTTTELTLRGERTRLERLLSGVESLLRDGWKRDREAEERRGRRGALKPWDRCFSCTAKPGRPAAGFWVHARGPDEWYISDVIPLEPRRLSAEESHKVLAEFEREFLELAAAEVGVETEVVMHRLTLEHDLSAEAVRRLRAFSTSASRTGLQPNDRHRWNAFLVRVHQDESVFDPALLEEWLQQEGWPEDVRCQLVSEYEAARSLLLAYDEEVPRR
jgi:hypothetical protein